MELYPTGLRLRVRGVQVHGSAVARATAGQRTAVNLAGTDVEGISRGMVLSEPGRFQPTARIDSMLELLPGALPLKHGAPVHFHAGTAEVEAEVRLLESNAPLQPGTNAPVRLLLSEPMLILPGERFIIRMFSPVVTIGGGEVVDIEAPVRMRRAAAAERVRMLATATAAERVALLVRESKFGTSAADLIARTGLMPAEVEKAATGLFIVREPHFRVVDPAWMGERAQSVQGALQRFHKTNPLSPGMAKEDLRAKEVSGAPPFLLDAILATLKTVVAEGEIVRLASHKVALKEDEAAALAKMEDAFASAGLAVPAMGEVLAKSGIEAARGRSLLQILLRSRKLVKIGDELVFHHAALDNLKQVLVSRKGQRFSVAEFKEWTGISRKYAIPLLEFLDRERVTRRDGESRVVL